MAEEISEEKKADMRFISKLSSALTLAHSISIRTQTLNFPRSVSAVRRKYISEKTGVSGSAIYNYFNPVWDEQGNLVYGPKSIDVISKLATLFGFKLSQLYFAAENCETHDQLYTVLAGFHEASISLAAEQIAITNAHVPHVLLKAS